MNRAPRRTISWGVVESKRKKSEEKHRGISPMTQKRFNFHKRGGVERAQPG